MNPIVANLNWRGRLERAIGTDLDPKSEEGKQLSLLAETWENCAVGENRTELAAKGFAFRTFGNEGPIDHDLSDLGVTFAVKVAWGLYDEALETLNKIEALARGEEVEDALPF